MPTSKTPKRTKKKLLDEVKAINEAYDDIWSRLSQTRLWKFQLGHLDRCWRCKRKKGHTTKCIAEQKKAEAERKRRELAEKRRRAKKITMTVGELEDKISEAEDRYRDDY